MFEKIKTTAKKWENKVTELRRHFHMYPETSWNEVETTKKIVHELEKMGVRILKVGFGGTQCGVLAEIEGAKPGKRVGLRADIDALPLNEEHEIEYKSKNDGVMHACGHDSHTAMLLGAAQVLQDIRENFAGSVRLFFQPAEEHGINPGAKVMIEEGALDGVDAIFGLHVMPQLPTGTIEYTYGPIMAAADGWELTVYGRGGHGSAPENAIDPTIAAANIVSSFQTVVSREVSPKETAVISIGGIKTSSYVFNIIPDRVDMNGSVRTFQPAVQDVVQSAMTRITEDICRGYRCRAELKYNRYLPATINHDSAVDLLKEVASELLGKDQVREGTPIMGSEDFSMFLQKIPGAYFFLGVGNPAGGTKHPFHSPLFCLNEDAMAIGVKLHAALAIAYLKRG